MTARVPVPLCNGCWRQRAGIDPPVREHDAPSRQCADCGDFTRSGIVVMDDPNDVQYPPPIYDEETL
jgi:hypothetical protein